MSKRVGQKLAALTLALLLAAVTVTTAIPSAGAHTVYEDTTRYRTECSYRNVMTRVHTADGSMTYKPERRRVCQRVSYTARVRRSHTHTTEVQCTAGGPLWWLDRPVFIGTLGPWGATCYRTPGIIWS